MNNYTKATIYMTFSTVCLAVMGATVKMLNTYSLSQVMFFRSFAALLTVLVFISRSGSILSLKSTKFKLHTLRSIFGISAMACSFYALRNLPLATASALLHTKTLFIVPLATFMLHEEFFRRRMLFTIIGFLGVIILLNPTSPDLSSGSLFGLMGAFFGALAMLSVRALGKTESATTIVFYFMLAGSFCSALLMINNWNYPNSTSDWVLLITTGIMGGLGQLSLVSAYKIAEASFVAPMAYLQLIWTAVIGIMFWNEIPTFWVISGSLVLVISQLAIQQHGYWAQKRFQKITISH